MWHVLKFADNHDFSEIKSEVLNYWAEGWSNRQENKVLLYKTSSPWGRQALALRKACRKRPKAKLWFIGEVWKECDHVL